MLFGSKVSYTATVREALAQMMADPEIMKATGAAKFTRSDKKTVGYFYFRLGKIYAATLNTYSPDVLTRLTQAGYLTKDAITKITRHFGEENLLDPRISDFVLDRHMAPEKDLAAIHQDFFLEAFSQIIEWDNVAADWRQNEVTEHLKIDKYDLDKVLGIIDTRQDFLKDVGETLKVPTSNLSQLVFETIEKPKLDDETALIFHQLFSISTGKHDVKYATEHFGLTSFRVIQALYELWNDGYMALTYKGKEIMSPATLVKAAAIVEDEKPKAAPVAPTVKEKEVEIPIYEENNEPVVPKIASVQEVIAAAAVVEEPVVEVAKVVVEPVAVVIEDTPTAVVEEEGLSLSELTEATYVDAPSTAGMSTLDRLAQELTKEVESLKVKVQTMRSELSAKETQYAALGKEIAMTTLELSKMEEEYSKIINKIDAIK